MTPADMSLLPIAGCGALTAAIIAIAARCTPRPMSDAEHELEAILNELVAQDTETGPT